MKKFFIIFLIMFCLTSCVNTKYHFQFKTVNNEILCDTTLFCTERFTFVGKDVKASIKVEQVNCKDTIYVFYYPEIEDQSQIRYLSTYRTTTPIIISKIERIN